MKAHRDGRRISGLQLDINVAHPAVESEFTRIDERPARLRAVVGEMNQVASGAFLETRRVPSQHKHRTLRPVADQSDSLPHINRPAEPVASRRNEYNAGVRRLRDAID